MNRWPHPFGAQLNPKQRSKCDHHVFFISGASHPGMTIGPEIYITAIRIPRVHRLEKINHAMGNRRGSRGELPLNSRRSVTKA
jgi:hypothetical protein